MIPNKKFSLTKIKKILLQRAYGIYKKQRKNLNQDSKNIFFVFCISLLLITTGGIGLEPIFIIPSLPNVFIGLPVLALREIN